MVATHSRHSPIIIEKKTKKINTNTYQYEKVFHFINTLYINPEL